MTADTASGSRPVPVTLSGTAVCPDPVFIIGSPRSGTTAVAHALGAHSGLWMSGESDILYHLFGDGLLEHAFGLSKSFPGGRWLNAEGVERDEFFAYLGLGLNALFTSRSRGRRWIDHTPLYTLMAEELAALFPGARFVHILRDGRDVVNSMLRFADAVALEDVSTAQAVRDSTAWSRDFTEACRTWVNHVEHSEALRTKEPGRCLQVAHAQLWEDPEAACRSILDFLWLPYEDGPFDFVKANHVNSSFPDGVRPTGWSQWTAEERSIFVSVAGPTMVRTGLAEPHMLDGAE